jgi:hypothetical protein
LKKKGNPPSEDIEKEWQRMLDAETIAQQQKSPTNYVIKQI